MLTPEKEGFGFRLKILVLSLQRNRQGGLPDSKAAFFGALGVEGVWAIGDILA